MIFVVLSPEMNVFCSSLYFEAMMLLFLDVIYFIWCAAARHTRRNSTRRKRRISSESLESLCSDVDSQSSACGILYSYGMS